MSMSSYVIGDNVDVYVDGNFGGHGKIVEASISVVKVQFRDQEGQTKTFDSQIGNSLAKNHRNGNWEINVLGSAIHDLP